MSFWLYLKSHAPALLAQMFGIVFAVVVLFVLNVEPGAIVFVAVVLLTVDIISWGTDYVRRRNFYRTLSESLKRLDEAYLITELSGRPDFVEGALFYDALAKATKAMNDKLGAYRISSEEYRDYVETWIHEVKTPIAAAHLLADNHDVPAVTAIDGEVSKVEAYVEQALYYARSSSLERDYSIREVQLRELVELAIKDNARMLIDAHVSPKLENLDFTVFTDAKWMGFVMRQLLINSAKYRKPGTEPSQLRIFAEEFEAGLDTACVALTIEDDGIGIPRSDLTRVFDKGFTGENGRRFAKSTGLGLYLVKKLCEKMGLSVSLESEADVGTSVHIVFPLNRSRLL